MAFERLSRCIKHGWVAPGALKRYFSADALARIERAIADSEASHGAEIRVVIEARWPWSRIWRRQTVQQRARQVFAQQGVWDTECNNGVLIYVSLADRQFELVADRGIHRLAGDAIWQTIMQEMQALFAQEKFDQAILTGIARLTELMCQHYARAADDVDELPNRPLLL